MAKREVTRKGWIRRILGLFVAHSIVTVLVGVVAFIVGWGSMSRGLADLSGWHEEAPESEFRAADAEAEGYGLDDYLEQEALVFDELAALVDGPWARESAGALCRFSRGSRSDPDRVLDRNWNRTFVLDAGEGAVGGALLVHGLSDSPYSLRVLGERLHGRGWTVVGLRVPGHGTCPRALLEARTRDWRAAVRVAAAGVRGMVSDDRPLLLVGFSNGGALCVDYAISSIEDSGLPRPDGMVLFSPMIGINPLAAVMRLHNVVEEVPGFEKAAWSSVNLEVDPFKYSSWPAEASELALAMTGHVEAGMARLARDGRVGEMPPVMAFQSAVDATVRVPRLISILFERLGAGSELVLFDVNRLGVGEELLGTRFEASIVPLIERAAGDWSLTVVTNESEESRSVVSRRWAGAGADPVEEGLGVEWPREIFSLSHGCPPISPDDPLYGTAEATRATGLPLGSLSLRGETGVLRISESLMIRLRHNPFYGYTEGRAMSWIDREVLGGE